ncbi:hypothetical protein AKO1_013508, partial [Acrasis kona]
MSSVNTHTRPILGAILLALCILPFVNSYNRCRAGRYFDPNSGKGMRDVIKINATNFEYFSAAHHARSDYVILGGTQDGYAHAELSPKPPKQYMRWTGIK